MKNWNKYSHEHYELILCEVKELFTETQNTMDSIINRGKWQLSLTIPILLSILGLLCSQNFSGEINHYLVLVSVPLLVSIIETFRAISAYKISLKGSKFESLDDEDLYSRFSVTEDAEKNLIRNICKNYDKAFIKNDRVNQIRMERIKVGSYALIMSPVSGVFALVVSGLFSIFSPSSTISVSISSGGLSLIAIIFFVLLYLVLKLIIKNKKDIIL